eukprot:1474229-Pyramimonas_sp.AAC.1
MPRCLAQGPSSRKRSSRQQQHERRRQRRRSNKAQGDVTTMVAAVAIELFHLPFPLGDLSFVESLISNLASGPPLRPLLYLYER